MYDQKTPNLQLPLPVQGNMLANDVDRIRRAFSMLDADSAAQETAIKDAKYMASRAFDETQNSTVEAVADMVIRRDAAGRAQVEGPVGDQDIANKGYVDTAAASPLTEHADQAEAHGAVVAATASRLVMRDGAGRAQFAAPSAAADAATKSYVDDLACCKAWANVGVYSDGTPFLQAGKNIIAVSGNSLTGNITLTLRPGVFSTVKYAGIGSGNGNRVCVWVTVSPVTATTVTVRLYIPENGSLVKTYSPFSVAFFSE